MEEDDKDGWWPGRVWVDGCFFWHRLTPVDLDKGPQNGRVCVWGGQVSNSGKKTRWQKSVNSLAKGQRSFASNDRMDMDGRTESLVQSVLINLLAIFKHQYHQEKIAWTCLKWHNIDSKTLYVEQCQHLIERVQSFYLPIVSCSLFFYHLQDGARYWTEIVKFLCLMRIRRPHCPVTSLGFCDDLWCQKTRLLCLVSPTASCIGS